MKYRKPSYYNPRDPLYPWQGVALFNGSGNGVKVMNNKLHLPILVAGDDKEVENSPNQVVEEGEAQVLPNPNVSPDTNPSPNSLDHWSSLPHWVYTALGFALAMGLVIFTLLLANLMKQNN